jgi:hypothetical protein
VLQLSVPDVCWADSMVTAWGSSHVIPEPPVAASDGMFRCNGWPLVGCTALLHSSSTRSVRQGMCTHVRLLVHCCSCCRLLLCELPGSCPGRRPLAGQRSSPSSSSSRPQLGPPPPQQPPQQQQQQPRGPPGRMNSPLQTPTAGRASLMSSSRRRLPAARLLGRGGRWGRRRRAPRVRGWWQRWRGMPTPRCVPASSCSSCPRCPGGS